MDLLDDVQQHCLPSSGKRDVAAQPAVRFESLDGTIMMTL
jgi:hypothetical protein